MAYYSFLKSSNDMFIEEIDDKDVLDMLARRFNNRNIREETLNLIKTPKLFNEFLIDVNLTKEEFLTATARLFADSWNHHLVKFVRKTYLNKPIKERKKKDISKKKKEK